MEGHEIDINNVDNANSKTENDPDLLASKVEKCDKSIKIMKVDVRLKKISFEENTLKNCKCY